MPRESQREGARDATRRRLLDAAQQVMEVSGIAGTTIRMIAKAAGVSEGSVYNHFTNKIDLVSTVFVERMPKVKLRMAVQGLLSTVGNGDPVAHLEEFVRAAVEAYEELDQLAGALSADPETFTRLREAIARLNIGPGRGYQALVAYLRLEEEQGRITLVGTPEVVAIALSGGCHEYAFLSMFHRRPPFGDEVDGFAEQLVRALVRRAEN